MYGLARSMSFGGLRSGLMSSAVNDPLNGGSGPSDGGTIGGGFHQGTTQGKGAGMDTMAMIKWNNNELNGMANDPTGGMSHQGIFVR